MNLKKFRQTGVLEMTEEDASDPGSMLVITNLIAKQQQHWDEECREIAGLYGVSPLWAAAIWYLRQRSRWTQELENQLIEMAHNGEEVPNMFEWPPDFWKGEK